MGKGLRRAPFSTNQSPDTIRRDLRALLRETAQPVAVVTSLMPGHETHANNTHTSRYHGATLSSFSSIALDPHPLIAFSLRIPSRMATSLKSAQAAPPVASHMVINILSAAQAAVAVRYSRPDLFLDPFVSTSYALTEEGLPVLTGSLGALSCKLVAMSWPLHDLEALRTRGGMEEQPWEGDGVASELFIAQVTRVESLVPQEGRDSPSLSPLLYHRRGYTTTFMK
ncbi:uncharacterized protein FIBRA_04703 [Fibroporia radiculosa]|uniref:Flavin reductase like domain-containing protein n=1 Tax=Fibroporia radiculosa TaxID=599839 RepID=J4GPP1_9APHY|nr:uncharacterized protein FIBRA_04703 [Fibroporia radiculosa]CCM02600.1 predicted protein [Fibroporia radiculosa]